MYEPFSDLGVFSEFPLIIAVSLVGGLVCYLSFRLSAGRRIRRLAFLTSISERRAGVLLATMIVAYALVFGLLSILRHDAFHSHAYDLGIFDQVVWNTARGRLFQNTVMLEYTANLLGNHFAPIFLTLVPLYWLWPDARVLLIVQTVALAAGAIPIFLFARRRLGSGWAPLAVSAAYLLFPALQYVSLFDFHEIAFTVPLLGFATLYLIERRDRLFLLFLFLALLCREEIAFVAVAYGVYIVLGQGRPRLGSAVMGLGLVWASLTIVILVPHFQGADDYYYVVRYGYLGSSMREIAVTLVSRPFYVLEHLLVRAKIDFVLRLLVPLGLLPFVGLEFLALALPTFFYLLLSDYQEQHTIFFQYTAPLIPFVFFATVQGMARLTDLVRQGRLAGLGRRPAQLQTPEQEIALPGQAEAKERNARRVLTALAVYVVVASLLSYYLYGPGPLATRFHGERYESSAHNSLGLRLVQEVPKQASLSAQSDLVPHLSQRERIYTFPNLHGADYVLLDAQSIPWPLSQRDYEQAVVELRRNKLYQLTFALDGYMLFKRQSDPSIAQMVGQALPGGLAIFGFDPLPALSAQGPKGLAVYWQATDTAAARERLSTFVLAIDQENQVVASDEKEPGYGSLRTDKWLTGEVVKVEYQLNLPSPWSAGEPRLVIGVRPVADRQRESADASLRSGPATAMELQTLPWK